MKPHATMIATILLGALAPATADCPADLDGDGRVDSADMGILLGNWLLYLASALVQQSLVVALSERPREDLVGLLFVPLHHPYRVFHRCVMLFAQFQELFTRASLRDPFAPRKVRHAMPDW